MSAEGLSIRDLVLEIRDDIKELREDRMLLRDELRRHEAEPTHSGAVGRKELYAAIGGVAGLALAALQLFF